MATTAATPNRKARSSRQIKFLIGAVLIFGAIGYLIFFGLNSFGEYYCKPNELNANPNCGTDHGLRVGGDLVQNSINRDIKGNQISFAITDGTKQLNINYSGVVPDTFDHATQVIAEGKLNSDGTFFATQVLAKCPSKYDAADTSSPANYQWQTFDNTSNTVSK